MFLRSGLLDGPRPRIRSWAWRPSSSSPNTRAYSVSRLASQMMVMDTLRQRGSEVGMQWRHQTPSPPVTIVVPASDTQKGVGVWSGEITYTNEESVIDHWVYRYASADSIGDSSNSIALGLDAETTPVFHKRNRGDPHPPVAVIQLATCTHALVAHVAHLRKKTLPRKLAELLQCSRTTFAGVGVLDDVRRVGDLFSVQIPQAVELRTLCVERGMADGPRGLEGLAMRLLGWPAWKSRSVTLSNWNQLPLTPVQIQYAALDAVAGRQLYDLLLDMPHLQAGYSGTIVDVNAAGSAAVNGVRSLSTVALSPQQRLSEMASRILASIAPVVRFEE